MSSGTITLTRTVPAAPEEVFARWTSADRLASWWWPQLAGTTYDVDARAGGHYRIVSPVIGATVSGGYQEVDPPRRLAFTWVWQDGDQPASDEDSVVVTFDAADEGTLLTIEHTSSDHGPDGQTEQGWTDVTDRLVRLFESQSTSSRS